MNNNNKGWGALDPIEKIYPQIVSIIFTCGQDIFTDNQHKPEKNSFFHAWNKTFSFVLFSLKLVLSPVTLKTSPLPMVIHHKMYDIRYISMSFFLLFTRLLLPIFSSHRRALWTTLSQEEGEGKWGKWKQNECFCNNLDPVHRIQTKFCMDILLDPRSKPAEEFFFFLKIQDGRRRSKICDALNIWMFLQ